MPADDSANKIAATGTKLALDHWLEKCNRRVSDGKPADCLPPTASASLISEATQTVIRDRLALTKTRADVERAFKNVSTLAKTDAIPKALGMGS